MPIVGSASWGATIITITSSCPTGRGRASAAKALALLGVTAAVQAVIYVVTGSVALLADLIHNGGDALTALPIGAGFLLQSHRLERWSGIAVVLAIFVSACVALFEAIRRLIEPQPLSHLGAAAAGVVGFLGNEAAAWVRLRAGRRLVSPRSSRTAITRAPTGW